MRENQEFRIVHGYRRAYLKAGTGPALLLIHGIGDSSRTWDGVLPLLAQDHTVIAPDLLGHGDSDKPRADYSLGGFANGMRDLLVLLGIPRVTVVGHSLGGGVAMQFAYQYPQMCERLILVSSGGFDVQVTPFLRAAALPGAGPTIAASVRAPFRLPLLTLARAAGRVGLLDLHEVRAFTQVWDGLRDPSTRSAFLRTLRSVIDIRGQTVSSRDRLYLATSIPMMLMWGSRDRVVPVAHALAAAKELPESHLEVVLGAGHLPHQTDPERFVGAVNTFMDTFPPSAHDAQQWRGLLEQRST